MYYVGTTAATFFFRPNEAFLEDIGEDPEWLDEMCRLATDWALNWICAQYEPGANGVAFIAETMGTLMISLKMVERFNLPNIARVVETVRKEFNQPTWLHIHGDIKTPQDLGLFDETGERGSGGGFSF